MKILSFVFIVCNRNVYAIRIDVWWSRRGRYAVVASRSLGLGFLVDFDDTVNFPDEPEARHEANRSCQ